MTESANGVSTTLFLIRHGETEWNRAKRIQGQLDVPLASSGQQQARQLAERGRWRRDGQCKGALDAIYSSDLARAWQTAEPLARAAGVPVQPADALRERHFGIFQGLTPDEVAQRHPQAYAHWQRRDASFTIPGGESLAAFYARTTACLRALAGQHAGQRIALVAHGGVLDCLYRFAAGLALDAPRTYPLLNASLNRVDADAVGCRIVTWGDVSHLDVDAGDEVSDGSLGGAPSGAVRDRVDPRVV